MLKSTNWEISMKNPELVEASLFRGGICPFQDVVVSHLRTPSWLCAVMFLAWLREALKLELLGRILREAPRGKWSLADPQSFSNLRNVWTGFTRKKKKTIVARTSEIHQKSLSYQSPIQKSLRWDVIAVTYANICNCKLSLHSIKIDAACHYHWNNTKYKSFYSITLSKVISHGGACISPSFLFRAK